MTGRHQLTLGKGHGDRGLGLGTRQLGGRMSLSLPEVLFPDLGHREGLLSLKHVFSFT